ITNPPRIRGVLGKASTYLPDLILASVRYTNFDPANSSYLLAYTYQEPTTGKWPMVKETTKTKLVPGWNLLTRKITIGGVTSTRTLFVFGDNAAPTFQIDSGVPTTINRADWNNGATWVLAGTFTDDSFGIRNFRLNFKLGDPKYFPDGLLHDAQGDYIV